MTADPRSPHHATAALAEADRLMTVCNSCRYCEGLCAVFPAMEMRRAFSDGDLDYLANLCHNCGACYVDCQFSPPHPFNVNVPRVLAEVRAESYGRHVWPGAFAPVFDRNGLWIALIAAASVALFIAGFVGLGESSALFAVHQGPGAFYRLMPHNTMAVLFGGAFGFAVTAIGIGLARFWRDTGAGRGQTAGDVAQAAHDAATLRYLDGGGVGCYTADERPDDRRRLYHHLTFYGFLLCFAATTVGTGYHYLLGRLAPYPWWDLPPMLGTIGGLMLMVGTAGLFSARLRREPMMSDVRRLGMDMAFTVMLFLTAATGLALHMLRTTPAMGLLLALHLGVVFALFITMPYGKFVHGLYRFMALARHARERRSLAGHG